MCQTKVTWHYEKAGIGEESEKLLVGELTSKVRSCVEC